MQNPKTEEPILRILHFNDVYDIQPNPKTKAGGAYAFKAYLDRYRNDKTITLFSGDAFSPSILSSLYHGQQMVHCLNTMHIDAACYGNHEFDFEIHEVEKLASRCNFPWLLGNLIDKRTEQPLAGALEHLIIKKNGLKIGVIGIAEQQWLTLLKEDYMDEVDYEDVFDFSKYKAHMLREEGCDLVIALSHMRIPNEKKLAAEVPEIDFILGGHDHVLFKQEVQGALILVSGTNFEHFSVIDIYSKPGKDRSMGRSFPYKVQTIKVEQTNDYDVQLKKYVDDKIQVYNKENQRVVAYTRTPLETRFSKIRTEETNYADFLADLVRAYYNVDCAALNSGSIRSDEYFEPGPLKFSSLNKIIEDYLLVKKVPGNRLLEMLEVSVSKYPSYDGRFMMVSGMRFTFDAAKPPMSRIVKESVMVAGKPLDLNHEYRVALREYSANGGDGYGCLKDLPFLIDKEIAINTLALITRFYRPAPKNQGSSLSLIPMSRRRSSKSDRLSEYILGIREQDGNYYVQIGPEKDGRIQILNAVDTG